MVKKTITIEDLAKMVKDGFDEMHRLFVTKEEHNSNFRLLVEEIRLIKDDIRDIKSSNLSLIGIVAKHDKDIDRIKDHIGMAA